MTQFCLLLNGHHLHKLLWYDLTSPASYFAIFSFSVSCFFTSCFFCPLYIFPRKIYVLNSTKESRSAVSFTYIQTSESGRSENAKLIVLMNIELRWHSHLSLSCNGYAEEIVFQNDYVVWEQTISAAVASIAPVGDGAYNASAAGSSWQVVRAVVRQSSLLVSELTTPTPADNW